MNRALIASLIALATCSLAAQKEQKEWSFPHTRANGRATPEYNHNDLHVVVNYDYAQRSHRTKWLLLDLALASKRPFILHRKDVTLLTPDGRNLPVAPQQELLEDSATLTLVLQNASISRRDLTSYFSQRAGGVPNEEIRFQAFPIGRTASDEVTVTSDHVTGGQLFFRTPQGRWDAGTYRLEVNTDAGVAAVPIKLE
jgi:hypothetical protein